MGKPRNAQAALDLLLKRLMPVHPEVYGQGQVLAPLKNPVLQVELSRKLPKKARVPDTFMGFDVRYKVTGWQEEGFIPQGGDT